MLAWTGMNINTNKIYISWLRRQRHFASRLEHGFQGSCRVLEMASSTLPKEWIGRSSRFFSCQCLWSGIFQAANVLRVGTLQRKHIEELDLQSKGTSCLLKSNISTQCPGSQAFLCCALAGWVPLGSPLRSSVSVPSSTGSTGSPTFIWLKIQALQGKYLVFYVFWKTCI